MSTPERSSKVFLESARGGNEEGIEETENEWIHKNIAKASSGWQTWDEIPYLSFRDYRQAIQKPPPLLDTKRFFLLTSYLKINILNTSWTTVSSTMNLVNQLLEYDWRSKVDAPRILCDQTAGMCSTWTSSISGRAIIRLWSRLRNLWPLLIHPTPIIW